MDVKSNAQHYITWWISKHEEFVLLQRKNFTNYFFCYFKIVTGTCFPSLNYRISYSDVDDKLFAMTLAHNCSQYITLKPYQLQSTTVSLENKLGSSWRHPTFVCETAIRTICFAAVQLNLKGKIHGTISNSWQATVDWLKARPWWSRNSRSTPVSTLPFYSQIVEGLKITHAMAIWPQVDCNVSQMQCSTWVTKTQFLCQIYRGI